MYYIYCLFNSICKLGFIITIAEKVCIIFRLSQDWVYIAYNYLIFFNDISVFIDRENDQILVTVCMFVRIHINLVKIKLINRHYLMRYKNGAKTILFDRGVSFLLNDTICSL